MMKKISILILTVLLALASNAQDVRTIETKVADILARMPVYNQKELNNQVDQFTQLGPEGWNLICDQVVVPGTGDDTRARFIIESVSRYAAKLNPDERPGDFEELCIKYAEAANHPDLFIFWTHQLELMGGKAATNFAAKYIADKELSVAAIAVVAAIESENASQILAESLKNKDLVSASMVMNTLADWGYSGAYAEYLYWYNNGDIGTKASALKAMASGGEGTALKFLSKLAKTSGYKWEPTGATEAYLSYADRLASDGNLKQMEKICNEVIKKTDYESGVQYKSKALSVLVKYKGDNSIDQLIKLFSNENNQFRNHALTLACGLKGEGITTKLLSAMKTTDLELRPGLIEIIGKRGDRDALADIKAQMSDQNGTIRRAAAGALVDLLGQEAAPLLISYVNSIEEIGELENAFSLLSTLTDSKTRTLIAKAYNESPELTKAFMLILIAEGGENKYFDMAIGETESSDELVRNAAFVSLKNVASEKDIRALIDLLKRTTEKADVEQVQLALANAANSIERPERRTDLLLKSLESEEMKPKVIPVLSRVGGSKALTAVLNEFNKGTGAYREVCFDGLSSWVDHSASYALFDICKSENTNYHRPAFQGYVRQISTAPITPEERLLLLRKIMPYAKSMEQKISVLNNIANVHTLPALMFAASYLGDDDVRQTASRVAMGIALPPGGSEIGLYGDNVKEVLSKVVDVIDGEESDYAKERIRSYIEDMPDDPGFVSMFNGKDLSGWMGLVENPISRAKMTKKELAAKQKLADQKMLENWSVKDGAIWFTGKGANLCSVKNYADFEMLVDWRITKEGDSGIYLRGTPQVQIWDTSRVEVGAQVGSGGLYNNSKNERNPIQVSDNPVGDWNTFRILMIGERVSVWLNGEIVVDDVVMENYWDRSIPIFPTGAIELQAHGNELAFRDIYVREIDIKEYNLTPEEKKEGFEALFNGSNLDNWINGDNGSYLVEDGVIVVKPNEGSGGNLYTEKEYGDFNYRFEFKLTPGANNGLGIRTPTTGDAAYVGMELQILDNTADIYANLQPYQYHGSVYGVIPAKRGFLRPVGEWNSEEVIVEGTRIKIILNDEVIVDGDIADARDNGTMDHRKHPGLNNEKGHIGFLGHGSVVYFRNIRIKDLSE